MSLMKTEPRDLTYAIDAKTLMLMQDFRFGGSFQSNFVYIDPFASLSYTTNVEYLKGILFQSITTRDKKVYLAGIGSQWFYKDAQVPPASLTNPNCPEYNTLPVIIVDKIETYSIQHIITPSFPLNSVSSDNRPITTYVFSTNCSN